ncbi:MAG: KTSC domain-containing protein [Chloroflexi bacterium]|nr:MAG: KTSC domain-containing protein [Chloroflexota bacterium]
MERAHVESSELASVGYDEPHHVLEVEFVAGGVYRYGGVPASTYRELMAADSLGRYFNTHIRGHYLYAKTD